MLVARTYDTVIGVDLKSHTVVWERESKPGTRTSFYPGGNVFAEYEQNGSGTVRFINTATGIVEQTSRLLEYGRLAHFSFAPNVDWVYASMASGTSTIEVRDSGDDGLSEAVSVAGYDVSCVIVNEDASTIVASTVQDRVLLCRIGQMRKVLDVRCEALSLFFSKDYRTFYTFDVNGNLSEWNADTGEYVYGVEYGREVDSSSRAILSDDGSTIVMSTGYELILWDTASRTVLGSKQSTFHVSGFIDGGLVVYRDRTIEVLNPVSMKTMERTDVGMTIVNVMTPPVI